jgi:hypothetical protein
MNLQPKLLISALALFFAVQASALPILVGEFEPGSSGDDNEHIAIRTAINSYNATPAADLSQLFGTGEMTKKGEVNLPLINGWVEFVPKTEDVEDYEGATDKFINFTAPGTYAEYYVFSKYGKGQGDFDSALHFMLAGEVLSYNPGGAGGPNGLSHVSIWARGTSTSVPDSGLTIALFGAGLMLLGVMKRRTAA